VLQAKELAPILSPSNVFTFGHAIESIKELGDASYDIKALVELDALTREFRWHQRRPISQYMRPWWKNPLKILMFHLRPLGRKNKKVMKNEKIATSIMTMEMKRNNQP
jgi:hypothetical protein